MPKPDYTNHTDIEYLPWMNDDGTPMEVEFDRSCDYSGFLQFDEYIKQGEDTFVDDEALAPAGLPEAPEPRQAILINGLQRSADLLQESLQMHGLRGLSQEEAVRRLSDHADLVRYLAKSLTIYLEKPESGGREVLAEWPSARVRRRDGRMENAWDFIRRVFFELDPDDPEPVAGLSRSRGRLYLYQVKEANMKLYQALNSLSSRRKVKFLPDKGNAIDEDLQRHFGVPHKDLLDSKKRSNYLKYRAAAKMLDGKISKKKARRSQAR